MVLLCLCLITMVISENKDLTFHPRLYGDGQNVIKMNTGKLIKTATHIIDLGVNSSNYFFW